jgi:hypothetical protein
MTDGRYAAACQIAVAWRIGHLAVGHSFGRRVPVRDPWVRSACRSLVAYEGFVPSVVAELVEAIDDWEAPRGIRLGSSRRRHFRFLWRVRVH